MRKVKAGGLAAVLGLLALLAGGARAQDKKAAPAPRAEQQAAMEAYMKAAAPGPEHARLARFAGDWAVTTRFWMAPGAPVQESSGTSTSAMVLGGRYLAETVHGTMMDAPFEGMGWTGYDNVTKRYQGVWIDNMGTAIMLMEGAWTPGGDEFTATGTYPDAATGKMATMRMVTRFASADEHVSTFYGPGPDGEEFETMEVTYRRK